MTTTKNLRMDKIEDHEGDGRCSECGREGLRWIARLSDGSGVGLECAKKILGFRPAPHTYKWVSDFEPIAERRDGGALFVLWKHKRGAQTRMTRDGVLTVIGAARYTWEEEFGWTV